MHAYSQVQRVLDFQTKGIENILLYITACSLDRMLQDAGLLLDRRRCSLQTRCKKLIGDGSKPWHQIGSATKTMFYINI